MKLSTKLYGAVGTIGAIGIVVAGAGLAYLWALSGELRVAAERTAVKLDLVNASRARAWEMVASLHSAYLNANLNNPAGVDANEKRWRAVFKRAYEQIAEIRPLLDTPEERANLNRLEAGLGEFGKASTDYMRISRAKQFEQLADVLPKVQAFANLADEVLTGFKDTQRKLLKAAQLRSGLLRSESLTVNIAMSCVLLVVIALAGFVVRNISRTLATAIGDLSAGAVHVASAAGEVSGLRPSLARELGTGGSPGTDLFLQRRNQFPGAQEQRSFPGRGRSGDRIAAERFARPTSRSIRW